MACGKGCNEETHVLTFCYVHYIYVYACVCVHMHTCVCECICVCAHMFAHAVCLKSCESITDIC